VDQAIALVNSLRSRAEETRRDTAQSAIPPDNILGPIINPPINAS